MHGEVDVSWSRWTVAAGDDAGGTLSGKSAWMARACASTDQPPQHIARQPGSPRRAESGAAWSGGRVIDVGYQHWSASCHST